MSFKSHTVNPNTSFCIMPWVHFYAAQNGNVTPCCQAPPQKTHCFGNINEESIDTIWKGEKINAFREKMLAGEKDNRCKQCYQKEEQGITSMRQITNRKYSEEIKRLNHSSDNLNMPVYFDIRFSNACNLKCRICGPWASSQWFKDAVVLGMRKENEESTTLAIKDEEAFFQELNPLLSSAKEFYFAGGEPLMMEQHYRVLQALIDCGNTKIQLHYNSNFSTLSYKQYNVIDYWKHFSNVTISASLDAEAEKGEFLRKNLRWSKVLENRRTLINEVPHVKFQITPTVCVFNVMHLTEFHKHWVSEALINVEDFIPNILIHPKEYHLNVLPIENQEVLKTSYQKHIAWLQQQNTEESEQLNHVIFQFNSILELLGKEVPKKSTQLLLEKTKQLDELRREKSSAVFPELNNLWG